MTTVTSRPLDGVRARAAEHSLARGPRSAELSLRGELDLGAQQWLTGLLAGLDQLATPLHLCLADVSFADTSGLQPLFDSARERAESGRPPLVLAQVSAPVARLLGLLGVPATGGLDVAAWDAAAARSRPPRLSLGRDLDVRCPRSLGSPSRAQGRCQLRMGHDGPHAAMFVRAGVRTVRSWSGSPEAASYDDVAGFEQRPWLPGLPSPAWSEPVA